MIFLEFIDKKVREAKKELLILKKIFENHHMKVKDFTSETDPYIFLYAPNDSLSFDGVRIYKIGNNLAYRIQREDNTHPYGQAYPLEIEDMFNDLISDNMDEKKAGNEIIKSVVEELADFFKKTENAEKNLRASTIDKERDRLGAVVIGSGGTDYANRVFNRGN